MFKKTRVLWIVHKSVSDVLFSLGNRDLKSTRKLMKRIDLKSFLSFTDMFNIYGNQRNADDTALQILICYCAHSIRDYGMDSKEMKIFRSALEDFAGDDFEAAYSEAISRADM